MIVFGTSFSKKLGGISTNFTSSLASEGRTVFKKTGLPVNRTPKWGAEGHSIVAEIAQRQLAKLHPDVLKKIQQLLGPGVTLASIASWADDERSKRRETSRWHYVNIPLESKTYDPITQCANIEGQGDCILAELQRLKNELRSVPADLTKLTKERREELKQAIEFAVHFIGDLHQPYHTIKEADGGNKIEAEVRFGGKTCPKCSPVTNKFHAVWDSTLIQRTEWSWGAYVDRLENGWLKDNAAKIPNIVKGTPTDWVLESHALAAKMWTVKPGETKVVLNEDYFREAQGVVDQQLSTAGVRLAEFLNEALGPGKSSK